MQQVILPAALVMMVLWLVVRVYRAVVMEPKRLRSSLQKQGITGPPPTFVLGNLLQIKKIVDEAKAAKPTTTPTLTHNCLPIIFPFLHSWIKEYGEIFMFSLGVQTMLHVSRPDLVKEIRRNMSWDLGSPSFAARELRPLFGRGILSSNGTRWAHQKEIISPHLYFDKIKEMMDLIADSSVVLINSWMKEIKSKGNNEGAIDMKIDRSLKLFGGDIMAKICFGKNFSQLDILDSKLERLGYVLTSDMPALTSFPVLRYIFPSKKSKEAWILEDEILSLIISIVKERKEEVGYEAKDFLQILSESAEESGLNKDAMNEFIVDNIKNMYVAGVDTISVSASWCLMLLASNPEWQSRVRAEVLHVCKGKIPDFSMLSRMKELTKVIYESLRLYSPVAVMVRETQKDMKIGDIFVAKGVNVWSHVYTLHTDPRNWGTDSFEFNPQRFANGIMGSCKFPHLYMPFGYGPRTCIGQHLAMVELKVIISLIVANFSFSISPNYVHSPIFTQIVKPEYGVNLVVKKV